METTITIKKNKPAYKALILIAKELEKNDHTSISISEGIKKKEYPNFITPKREASAPFDLFEHLSDFPTLVELRKKAWPKVS
jgi:hypothetical protein